MLMNKEKKIERSENRRVVGRTLSYMLKTVLREKPSLYLAYLVGFLSVVLQKIQVVLLPKFLIDELVLIIEGEPIEKHLYLVGFYTSLICISILVSNIMGVLEGYLKNILSEWFDQYFNMKLAEKVLNIDYEYMESPEMLERLQKARGGISGYSGGAVGVLNGLYSVTINGMVLLGVGVAILWKSPWLFPIQFIALFVLALFNAKSNEIETQSYEKRTRVGRKFGYYMFHLTDVFYGKEIRLYDGLGIWNRKVEKIEADMNSVEKEVNRSQCYQICWMDVINALRDALSYFYIGYLALKKKIGIGDVSLCIASASELYHGVRGVVFGWQDLLKRCKYVEQFIDFMDVSAAFKKGEKIVADGKHTVEFSHVYFKYPGSEEYILKDINLKIQAGEHLALVGMNGMGKTTLIKLLCRLYNVSKGEILIDGINIMDYSEEEYRKLFSVVFQDYQIFAFSLRENIAFENSADDFKVLHSLEKAGMLTALQELPEGLDTVLAKGFDENGIELSGGQVQKVAIARALYRNAPIVILDEPTSALDPMAEHEIYTGFNRLVKEKTAIFISHRLSSCKFCDRIAVIDGGTIKEYGTHEELMRLQSGIYAEMFTTQAQYYVG